MLVPRRVTTSIPVGDKLMLLRNNVMRRPRSWKGIQRRLPWNCGNEASSSDRHKKVQRAGVRWIYYLGNSPVVTQKYCDILFITL